MQFGSVFFLVEGTTTNGDFLLPFKSGAFLSGAPVQPVILRYPYQRLSPAWDSISGVSLWPFETCFVILRTLCHMVVLYLQHMILFRSTVCCSDTDYIHVPTNTMILLCSS